MKKKILIGATLVIIAIGFIFVHPEVTSPTQSTLWPLNSAYAITCSPFCNYSSNLNFTLYKENETGTFSKLGKMLFLEGINGSTNSSHPTKGLTWEGDIDLYGNKVTPGTYKFSFVRNARIAGMSFPIQFGESKNFKIVGADVIGVDLKVNGNSEKEIVAKREVELNLEWEINTNAETKCFRYGSGFKSDYSEEGFEGVGGGKTILPKSGSMKINIPTQYTAVQYRLVCIVNGNLLSDFVTVKII